MFFSQFPFKDMPLNFGIVYSFKRNRSNAIYYDKRKRHIYVRAVKKMGISYFARNA